MKKKLLSLALALCLGLTVPALAVENDGGVLTLSPGETAFTLSGITFTLSSGVIGQVSDESATFPQTGEIVNVVPAGTAITFSPAPENIDDLVFAEVVIREEENDEALAWGSPEMADINGGIIGDVLILSGGDDLIYLCSSDEGPGKTLNAAGKPAGDKKEETPAETPAGAEKPAETPAAPSGAFTDVDPASPFAGAIQWAVAQKITNGKTDTTFGPGDTCTRGQILTFLYRANGSPKPKAEAALGAYYKDWEDIPASFADAARWVNDEHLMRNFGSVFGAATPCTRGEAMTHLWAAAGRPSASSSFIEKFTDMQGQSDELSEAVAWAVQHKITTGTTETTFSPDALCTRGQIVTFLYRAYAK